MRHRLYQKSCKHKHRSRELTEPCPNYHCSKEVQSSLGDWTRALGRTAVCGCVGSSVPIYSGFTCSVWRQMYGYKLHALPPVVWWGGCCVGFFFVLWCFFFNTQVSVQAADISGTTFLQFQVFSCHLLTSLCSVLSCCCPVGHDLLCNIKVEIICKSNMY